MSGASSLNRIPSLLHVHCNNLHLYRKTIQCQHIVRQSAERIAPRFLIKLKTIGGSPEPFYL
jgi:hypothetical protein